jgi:DNA (cytosine-5)-methyltransferase 1
MSAAKRPKVTIYLARDGWRWRLKAKNGRIQAVSSEAYVKRWNAWRAYLQVDAALHAAGSRGLVLSLFPGIGMLDKGFEEEGFCVVRGPDLLWGGDIREFHPPSGVFDGVIGGPPCPSHSSLRHQIKASGNEPEPDLVPEFARVICASSPRWWVMENAPDCPPPFQGARFFIFNNRWLGEKQNRRRMFYSNLDLRRHISGAPLEAIDWEHAVTSDARPVSIPIAGGKRKSTADRPRRLLGDALELQGFKRNWLDHSPFTMQAKRKMVGNGVPLPMSRAIARAVVKALEAK